MTGKERIIKALEHKKPDRTPLFEIFQPFHPIHWDICGKTIATDAAMCWDAMSDGENFENFLKASIDAQYKITSFFGLDMVELIGLYPGIKDYKKPEKTGRKKWKLDGIAYKLNERTKLVEVENIAEESGYTYRFREEDAIKMLEEHKEQNPAQGIDYYKLLMDGVREKFENDGRDVAFIGEIGAGTGAAFYPPFLLMWMIEKPELYKRWLDIQKINGFQGTRRFIENGCSVIAMGGDVSCDKGPFISPKMYNHFILPVIQEHVNLIHSMGARAVYTSDGNHWAIKQDFFFNSGIDGYKEVDKSAGMTWPRLIEEGVADRICIIGNIDARYTMCNGTVEDVKKEVTECLNYGLKAKAGHILHLSHSVHEDVKTENYYALIDTYRRFFNI